MDIINNLSHGKAMDSIDGMITTSIDPLEINRFVENTSLTPTSHHNANTTNNDTLDTGLTIAIKDSIDIAGLPTRLGSLACIDNPPVETDASIVNLLKQHNFSIVGKTLMHELAYGMTGINNIFGSSINPLYPNLITGGSSSGSATSVASRTVDVSIGTDTGGSVRLPAACCGIYGLKPTYGLVSREGVWPTDSSLDCVGVFANSPKLITQTMKAIAPQFSIDSKINAQIVSESHINIGLLSVDAEKAITKAVNTTLSKIPFVNVIPLESSELSELDDAFNAGLTIINRETWLACKEFFATGKVGDDVAIRLEKASYTTDKELEQAEKVRQSFTAQVDTLLATTRILALPTLPHFPMTVAQAKAGHIDVTISKLVRPFNVSGHPAITIPCFAEADMPIGIQLVGRKGDDAYLCAVCEKIAEILAL